MGCCSSSSKRSARRSSARSILRSSSSDTASSQLTSVRKLPISSKPIFKQPITVRYPIVEGVVTVWISRLAPDWKRLSFNILREIIQFLRPKQVLFQIRRKDVVGFDIGERKWKLSFALTEDLSQHYYKGHAIALVTSSAFLVCGGRLKRSVAHFIDCGAVVSLPDMIAERYAHCAISVRTAGSVFVFGGSNKGAMSDCEGFRFASGQWESLSSMRNPRKWFNCCSHHDLVYLCGGDFDNSVETYDWTSDQFALIPQLWLPIDRSCVSAIVGETCLCISLGSSCSWRLAPPRKMRMYLTNISTLDCSGPVCVTNNSVFVVGEDGCVCYSCEDGSGIASWPLRKS